MQRKPRTFRAEAIVLHHSDWGEADRLLSLYTPQLGKVRAIVKGARKLRSRKAGHLEPMTRVSLLLATGRSMHIVTQAEMLDAHAPLREDLTLLGYANYLIELLDRFTYEGDENSALYRLLARTLKRLSQSDDPLLVLRFYEIRLLDLMGYRPELSHCVVGGEEIQPEDQYFSAIEGGVLCPKDGIGTRGARPISVDALRYLRHFQRSTFSEAARARISPATHQELEVLMQHYLTFLLERGLNTPAFIRRVRRKE